MKAQTEKEAEDDLAAFDKYIWVNYKNLIGFWHFGVFLSKSTFAAIKGHPEQYILVDTIFNYRFHFGLPGKCL